MFCSKCGNDVGNDPFCSKCGNQVGSPSQPAQATATAPVMRTAAEEVVLWEGAPAGLADKAKGKLNTMQYKVTTQRIIMRFGLLGKKEIEIDLKHVKDLNVKQSIADRVAKVGDIILTTTDPTQGTVSMENVRDPFEVKEIIRKALMDYRANIKIQYHEGI